MVHHFRERRGNAHLGTDGAVPSITAPLRTQVRLRLPTEITEESNIFVCPVLHPRCGLALSFPVTPLSNFIPFT
jgi:hypothetical protein